MSAKKVNHRKADRATDRFDGRCTPEQKDQLYRIAKSRGMNFTQMVLFDYLRINPETIIATKNDEILLNMALDLRRVAAAIEALSQNPTSPRMEEELNNIGHAVRIFGYTITEHIHDHKKQPTRKR